MAAIVARQQVGWQLGQMLMRITGKKAISGICP